MNIRLVPQEDIDQLKWDSCIHYSENGSVFGYQWFMNNTAKEWDGLVEGDYESVFPLVKKADSFSRKELYQPMLIRSLGIFSIHLLSAVRMEAFFNAIPKDYKKINIDLNERHQPLSNEDFNWSEKRNFQLWLDQPYEVLRQNYAAEILEQLKEASRLGLRPVSNIRPEIIADHFKKYTKQRGLVEEKFHALQRIMYNALHRGIGFASGVEDSQGNLLVANFYIYSHGKLLSLIPMEIATNKTAQIFGIDLLMQTNAGRPLIFDLNSSDESLKKLGALPNSYYTINKNDRKWGLF